MNTALPPGSGHIGHLRRCALLHWHDPASEFVLVTRKIHLIRQVTHNRVHAESVPLDGPHLSGVPGLQGRIGEFLIHKRSVVSPGFKLTWLAKCICRLTTGTSHQC